MMSDALAAANMISGDLAFYRMMDGLRAARTQNNEAAKIAALQALVQRLADYGRYAEQQHNSLLAEAKRIDAQRCQQINAQLDKIDALQREIADLRRQNHAQQLEVANLREVLGSKRAVALELAQDRLRCIMEAGQLERRVAALEAENACLREASQSD